MSRALILGVLLVCASSARASTHDAHREVEPGFILQVNLSSGSMRGPEAGRLEQESIERQRQNAKRAMGQVLPLVRGMIQHYRKGRHPYHGAEKWLQPALKSAEHGGAAEISLDLGPVQWNLVLKSLGIKDGTVPGEMFLFLQVKTSAPREARAQVQRDFLLAQLFGEGILAKLQPARDRRPDDALSESALTFQGLFQAQLDRDWLAEIARDPTKLPLRRRFPVEVEYESPNGQTGTVTTEWQEGEKLALDPQHYIRPRIVKKHTEACDRIFAQTLALAALWTATLRQQPFPPLFYQQFERLAQIDSAVAGQLFELLDSVAASSQRKAMVQAFDPILERLAKRSGDFAAMRQKLRVQ